MRQSIKVTGTQKVNRDTGKLIRFKFLLQSLKKLDLNKYLLLLYFLCRSQEINYNNLIINENFSMTCINTGILF